MSRAIGFRGFQESHLKIDTIPKPGGLGSDGGREARMAHWPSLNIQ
jgi:hypothetical protein